MSKSTNPIKSSSTIKNTCTITSPQIQNLSILESNQIEQVQVSFINNQGLQENIMGISIAEIITNNKKGNKDMFPNYGAKDPTEKTHSLKEFNDDKTKYEDAPDTLAKQGDEKKVNIKVVGKDSCMSVTRFHSFILKIGGLDSRQVEIAVEEGALPWNSQSKKTSAYISKSGIVKDAANFRDVTLAISDYKYTIFHRALPTAKSSIKHNV